MKKSHTSVVALSLLILLAACSKKQPVTVIDKSTGEHAVKQVMPGAGPVDVPGHGKEVWLAVGAMQGVGGSVANGVAQAHYVDDGTSIVTVQLNIEVAAKGSFYEAWLVGSNAEDRMTLGHLRNPFGDVRHSLKYLETADVRAFTKVEVTRELDDGNPEAGVVVAEAVLKERIR